MVGRRGQQLFPFISGRPMFRYQRISLSGYYWGWDAWQVCCAFSGEISLAIPTVLSCRISSRDVHHCWRLQAVLKRWWHASHLAKLLLRHSIILLLSNEAVTIPVLRPLIGSDKQRYPPCRHQRVWYLNADGSDCCTHCLYLVVLRLMQECEVREAWNSFDHDTWLMTLCSILVRDFVVSFLYKLRLTSCSS